MHCASRSFSIVAASWAALRLLGLVLLPGACLWAQSLPAEPLAGVLRAPLKRTPLLQEKPAVGPGNEVPTFVFGDQISGRPELDSLVEGNAEMRRGKTALRADRIEYFQPSDFMKSRGNVRVSNAGNLYWGPALDLKLDSFEGTFTSPAYRFVAGGNGAAQRVDFAGEKRMFAWQGTYTTCERDNEASWLPAWQLRGHRFYFDFETEVGEITGATVRFQDVPLLHWPGTLTFPLSSKRKSGVLSPTYGLDTTSGVSLTVPYYFDIAPNRDATVTPTYMAKRGVNLANEFRYLEPGYSGTLRANYMPSDKLRDQERWSYSFQHNAILQTGVPAIGGVGLGLNLNRVGDTNYWRDFPGASGSLTQRLLPNDVKLSWARNGWSSGLLVQHWQTLSDPSSPIVPPYDRLPQLSTRYGLNNARLGGLSGLNWAVDADLTQFSAIGNTSQPNATRAFTRGQISRPWSWPAGYITPKLLLNATSYQFETAHARTGGGMSTSRVVPTFSLDGGLQFERDERLFGRAFIQTLEPRAFYVRTPYRNQNNIPNYDSGDGGFNVATVFTENAFVGNDKISDANLLTLGLTSRLIDDANGAEVARIGAAQRLRFEDQRVTLAQNGTPVTQLWSDILVGGSVKWTKAWSVDATTQYNPEIKASQRSTLAARYSPSNYRLATLAYQRERATSEMINVGWQWPVNDLWGDKGQALGPGLGQGGRRWYSVGRMNFNMVEQRMVDSLYGFEYDGCCWIGRAVLQRTYTSRTTSNTQIMFQIEFVGLSYLGNNPLGTLRSNIPLYQNLRSTQTSPSRFTNYD